MTHRKDTAEERAIALLDHADVSGRLAGPWRRATLKLRRHNLADHGVGQVGTGSDIPVLAYPVGDTTY